MKKFLFANNARGTLKLAIAALDTQLTLNAGQGALFPVPGALECFRATLIDTSGDIEIIEVTTVAGDVFPVMQRGMEGTIPRAFNINDRVGVRLTKEILEYLRDSGGFLTGDYRLTLRNVAATGWIMCNDGTIGNAGSGANYANADAANLYALLWNNVSNTYAPVSTGRGVNAAADFAANKTIGLTKKLGRALCIAGAGAGLTARALGQTLGEEGHVQLLAEMAAHSHGGVTGGQSADHTHFVNAFAVGGGASFSNAAGSPEDPGGVTSGGSSNDHTHTIASSGSGSPANVMQPSGFDNLELKL